MSNIREISPFIPTYEEFKRGLVQALLQSQSNFSKEKENINVAQQTENPSPMSPPNTQISYFQPYGSRIYQRRALRQARLNSPYTRST